MLLEIVSFARNIGSYFHTVGEADTGYFSNGGVRLTRGLRGYLSTDASFERRRIEGRAIFKRIKAASQREHTRLRRFVFPASL